jgi:hypothetical protein
MSAPSSTTSSEAIERGYLVVLAGSVALLLVLFLAFTFIIDPYGVSPVQMRLVGVNALKPKRLDIDRLIKPYEVWRHQPRTVFLGTSRIHQSIDPAVLDGTRFAPAYNASIPASTLSENAAHIASFFEMDRNLRAVFVELFLYNFVAPTPAEGPPGALLPSALSLFVSAGSAFNSMQTLLFNVSGRPGSAHVAARGQWVAAANFTTSFGQDDFIKAIMKIHDGLPPFALQTAAFAALDRIVDLCRRHDAELHLLITPNYPWDDYRLLSMGYWPLLEDWLRKISAYPNVVSFSQYNELLEEPPAPHMKYWNDPIHFNARMGHLMLNFFLGVADPEAPSNLMRRLSPETIEAAIRERRIGLNEWMARNPSFTTAFDKAKIGSMEASGGAR